MKIGIVSNLYPPEGRGGAELVAQRTADALYKRGHDVVVLSTEPFQSLRSLFIHMHERTLADVFRFFPLNLYHLSNDYAIPFPARALWHLIDLVNPFSRNAIKQLIAQEEFDVIITHNLKGIGVSIAREIQKHNIPHIHVLHDVQLSVPSGLLIAGEEESWLNRSRLRKGYEKLVKHAMGSPNLVISPSQFLLDYYQDRGLFTDGKTTVLPNPAPPHGQQPRQERISSKLNLLFIGQLEEHKGIKQLFDAFESFDDAHLHIAGEGGLADYVRERASTDKRIRYHGFVSLNHLIDLLQQSDAVVLPSICYENSPTVIYESFLVGVPVIASNIGGIPELIQEGKNGLLVEPGNVQALKDGMKNIAENRDEWWKKSEAIQRHAQRFAIDRYVSQMQQLIQETVQQHHRKRHR